MKCEVVRDARCADVGLLARGARKVTVEARVVVVGRSVLCLRANDFANTVDQYVVFRADQLTTKTC